MHQPSNCKWISASAKNVKVHVYSETRKKLMWSAFVRCTNKETGRYEKETVEHRVMCMGIGETSAIITYLLSLERARCRSSAPSAARQRRAGPESRSRADWPRRIPRRSTDRRRRTETRSPA